MLSSFTISGSADSPYRNAPSSPAPGCESRPRLTLPGSFRASWCAWKDRRTRYSLQLVYIDGCVGSCLFRESSSFCWISICHSNQSHYALVNVFLSLHTTV
jgi:hypothetical protein